MDGAKASFPRLLGQNGSELSTHPQYTRAYGRKDYPRPSYIGWNLCALVSTQSQYYSQKERIIIHAVPLLRLTREKTSTAKILVDREFDEVGVRLKFQSIHLSGDDLMHVGWNSGRHLY